MNWEFKISGTEEDHHELKIYTNAMKMYCIIHETKERIRKRLKYEEEITEKEEEFLEELQTILFIDEF